MAEAAARFRFEDLQVGQTASFEARLSPSATDAFAELSGDVSPLHLDAPFARARGFGDRVVHGAHLTALVSRLVGVHLPGENAILHSLSVQFRAPVLVGTRVSVAGVIDQISPAVRAAVMRVEIRDCEGGGVVASGKAGIGFTQVTADREPADG